MVKGNNVSRIPRKDLRKYCRDTYGPKWFEENKSQRLEEARMALTGKSPRPEKKVEKKIKPRKIKEKVDAPSPTELSKEKIAGAIRVFFGDKRGYSTECFNKKNMNRKTVSQGCYGGLNGCDGCDFCLDGYERFEILLSAGAKEEEKTIGSFTDAVRILFAAKRKESFGEDYDMESLCNCADYLLGETRMRPDGTKKP